MRWKPGGLTGSWWRAWSRAGRLPRVGDREVLAAELDGVLAQARRQGHDTLVIERVIVDPPPRPEALH